MDGCMYVVQIVYLEKRYNEQDDEWRKNEFMDYQCQ